MSGRAVAAEAFRQEVPNFIPATTSASSFTARQVRVRVHHPRSEWIAALSERFDELTALPKGWDGYGGLPVSFGCAQFAAHLVERLYDPSIPAPNLVPGSDGTVQIEWHRNGYDVEIDVTAPYEVVAYRHDLVSGNDEEVALQTDFTQIADWIGELKRARQVDASARA
mgnify:CR=1 FL=1